MIAGILLAFCACIFKIYGQQNEIRQWKERAINYQRENQTLQEQIAAQRKDEKTKSIPINFSYSDDDMNELERYRLESKIRDLQSDLDYEKLQRDIDRNNFEMYRYDSNYSPY